MKTYILKLKHILPTFLAVTFGTVFGIAFIRWLLCIQFSLIDIKEEVWLLWLPLIFPWIPITLWLRQRFRVLIVKKGDADRTRFFFQIISWMVMTAMLFVSQAFLTTVTGKLQTLSNINDILKVESARYYKLENFSVAKYFGGSYTDFRTSGKYNENLNFDIFFVIPIIVDSSKRIRDIPKYWYGVKYKQQVSNKISNEEKSRKYKEFYDESVQKMNNYNFHSLEYFERKPKSDDKINFLRAIEARIKQQPDKSFIVLEPIHEAYENKNGNKFAWIFGSFGIGFGVLLFSLIFPGFSEKEYKMFLSGKKRKHDEVVDMLQYLIPKGKHFATSIILNLNIITFLLMFFSGIDVISPSGKELLDWGANRRFETVNGEWWRILTSMFLHGGIMHLLLNIVGLLIASIFLETILGRKKLLILYILSGLCGSLASVWWYSNTISVGASGAIFGLYGAILGLLIINALSKGEKNGILTMFGIYVGVNLLWGLTGGIDNAAHIGGLLSGALIGLVLYKPSSTKNKRK